MYAGAPSAGALALVLLASLAWAAGGLALAGWLKLGRRWRTGYTRKLFHVLIFCGAALVRAGLGFGPLCAFGLGVSAVVGYALLRGDGHPFYEAMAREQDAPRRTAFIVAPWCATLLGGLLAAWLAGPYALVGLCVAGLGDAAGEPVGVRFGRHPYRVPSPGGLRCVRSLQGSLAVFGASALAVVLAASAGALGSPSLGSVLVLALASAVVEALSPHGWDNLTLILLPSLLARWWM